MPGVVGVYTNREDMIDHVSFRQMCEMIRYKSWHTIDNQLEDGNFSCASVQGYRGNIRHHEDKVNEIDYWLDGDILSMTGYCDKVENENLVEVFKQISNSVCDGALVNVLSSLNGVFSLVIYDKRNKKLRLCSDRHGLRHVYYYSDSDNLIFSSEQKSIIASSLYNGSVKKESVDLFMRRGYLADNLTWFENIYLLPPSSIIEWDAQTKNISISEYRSPRSNNNFDRKIDIPDLAYELGEKFVNAVSLNVRKNERVGIGLSGGLDSRALLAACEEIGVSTLTYTFGNKNSEEISIAKKVADIAQVKHKTYEISSDNWLQGRNEAIIRGEGVPGFQNLHNMTSIQELHDEIDVKLDGYLGDATIGGGYLNYDSESEQELILNRGRRRIISGPQREMSFFNVRLPFFEKEFYELSMSIPAELRRNSYVYRCMLLERFPKYFKSIPVLETGLPINKASNHSVVSTVWIGYLRKFFLKARRKNTLMANYPEYIRVEPGLSFAKNLLFNQNAEYNSYLDSKQVISKFEQHLNGENNLEYIGKVITLELWLQYVKKALQI